MTPSAYKNAKKAFSKFPSRLVGLMTVHEYLTTMADLIKLEEQGYVYHDSHSFSTGYRFFLDNMDFEKGIEKSPDTHKRRNYHFAKGYKQARKDYRDHLKAK